MQDNWEYQSALLRSLFIFLCTNVVSSFFRSLLSMMNAPSTSLIGRNRPLTRIALDNKIRAMMSQFHPRERQFVLIAHENALERSYPNHSLPSKISLISVVGKQTRRVDQVSLVTTNTDEFIYTYKKVTQWLEDLDYDLQKKNI